jgi:hypothetical protein
MPLDDPKAGLALCDAAMLSPWPRELISFSRMLTGGRVKRREFLTYAGGIALAWPLSANAQRADQMRRVGVLSALTAADPEGQARVAAFREAYRN